MPKHSNDSDDSYRSRSRKKSAKNKRRKSSSSLSSTSSDGRSVEKSKPKQYKRSRSRERSKHHHKSSSHSSKRHHKRSRSSSNSSDRSRAKVKKHSSRGKERSRRSPTRSPSRNRSTSRSRKRSTSRTRKRSTSRTRNRSTSRTRNRSTSRTRNRSTSRSRNHYKSKRSRSVTPKKSKVKEQVHRKDRDHESTSKKVAEDDSLRNKLEAALKAAAEADAVLRQKGFLEDSIDKKLAVTEELTLNQQLKRAQAIEDINSNSFSQQAFTSNRSWGKKSLQDPDAATTLESSEKHETKNGETEDDDWRTNAEKLVHPSWFGDQTERLNRWKKKLSELRNGQLNGEGVAT